MYHRNGKLSYQYIWLCCLRGSIEGGCRGKERKLRALRCGESPVVGEFSNNLSLQRIDYTLSDEAKSRCKQTSARSEVTQIKLPRSVNLLELS